MCEMNDNVVNTTGQPQETTAGEETSHEGNGVVKFDIGEFVHNQRKIHLLLGPWIRFYNTLTNIICWSSPYISLFWLTTCCIIAVKSPVCFIIMPLVYIVIVMAMSGIKRRGVHKNTTLGHRTIKKIIDEKKKNLKTTVEKQVQEDLTEFTSLLIQLETLSEWISNSLDNANRILKWEDFNTSLCIFVGVLLGIVVLLFVPLTVILLVAVLSLFCLNNGFRPVAMEVMSLVTCTSESLLVVSGLRELFSHRSKKKLSSNSFNDPQDEWYDAQSDERVHESSDDETDNDTYEESSLNKKKLDQSSILTQLSDYRRKQKKLNSGKCSHCQVPFSSILKKRQYCRHCGESFCSKCCSDRVKRSVFGATAPAAYEETVLVCRPCYDLLMNVNDNPGPPW